MAPHRLRAVVALLTVCLLGAPGTAQASDLQYVGTVTSRTTSAVPASGLLGLVSGAATRTSPSACEPRHVAAWISDTLRADVYARLSTGDILYNWTAEATATATGDATSTNLSRHCAQAVYLTMQVSDISSFCAPDNVVLGSQTTSGAEAPTVVGTADVWVRYYGAQPPCVRATSVVRVAAKASYLNNVDEFVDFACLSKYWPVTATPAGPHIGAPVQTDECF